MKEQVLEILKKEASYHSEVEGSHSQFQYLCEIYFVGIASKIADMVQKFVEWKDKCTEYSIEHELYVVEIETHVIELMDFDGVFTYWHKNIYKSTDK